MGTLRTNEEPTLQQLLQDPGILDRIRADGGEPYEVAELMKRTALERYALTRRPKLVQN